MARKYRYNIVKNNGKASSITVFYKGEDHVATPAHPNFTEILRAVAEDRPVDELMRLFDPKASIGDRLKGLFRRVFTTKTPSGKAPSPTRPSERGRRERLRRIGEKVSVRNGEVFYAGVQMHGALADVIGRYIRDGNPDWEPLALFLDKVMTNPNKHSREQLYTWLSHMSFQITDDGDIIGYKGVRHNYLSSTRGSGKVNGKPVNGNLDNSIGNIVEMPRNMVTHDPGITCSHGLHVGTWGYAKNFASRVVRVVVNPRDVVSVPTDCSGQKLRVCKYRVLEDADKAADKIHAGSVHVPTRARTSA